MNKETGGAAFPHENHLSQRGMTLRDYFAAKAMQGIVTDPGLSMDSVQVALWAYKQADAMILERNKNA